MSEPIEEGPRQQHKNVPPVEVTPDRRMTARHVERLMREHFLFPAVLDAKVTEAADAIAQEIIQANHEIVSLYWNDASGNA